MVAIILVLANIFFNWLTGPMRNIVLVDVKKKNIVFDLYVFGFKYKDIWYLPMFNRFPMVYKTANETMFAIPDQKKADALSYHIFLIKTIFLLDTC